MPLHRIGIYISLSIHHIKNFIKNCVINLNAILNILCHTPILYDVVEYVSFAGIAKIVSFTGT
jgi:hypothetical protein